MSSIKIDESGKASYFFMISVSAGTHKMYANDFACR